MTETSASCVWRILEPSPVRPTWIEKHLSDPCTPCRSREVICVWNEISTSWANRKGDETGAAIGAKAVQGDFAGTFGGMEGNASARCKAEARLQPNFHV